VSSARQSLDTIRQWLRACIDEGQGLTDWEQTFITDLEVQVETYGRLSEKQEETLERIYANKTP
jgi:hypothetical protein